MVKRVISLFFLILCVASFSVAQDSEDLEEAKRIEKEKMEKRDYIPEIHGTIRAKYEYSPTINKQRFQVRNARLSITGNVLPIVAYKAEIDLSDEGRMRMLDAYARVFPYEGIQVTLGQMKIPFSTENLRSPHNMYFANRSFIAKQVTGLRDVGLLLGYELKEGFPFQILGGVYNGTGLDEQKEWQTHFNYALRAVFTPVSWLNVALNYESVQPETLRMNLYDASAFANFYGFHVEAEYLYKSYAGGVFTPTQAFVAFACYDLSLPKVFSSISFLVRYDMMTDNHLGYLSTEGTREVDDVHRQRMTYGVTLRFGKKNLVDMRIN